MNSMLSGAWGILDLWLLQSQLKSQQPSEDSHAKLVEALEEENEMLRSEVVDLLREKEELGQFLKQQVETFLELQTASVGDDSAEV